MTYANRAERARAADLHTSDHLPTCAYCDELSEPGATRCSACGLELTVELDVELLTRSRTIPARRRP